jgi:transmembrane sensor
MVEQVGPRPELQQQAWDWLRLLASGQASDLDARALARWVGTSPAHQAAYNEARRRWGAMHAATGSLLRADPALAAARGRVQQPARLPRRAVLGAAVAAGVAGIAVGVPWLGAWPATMAGSEDRTAAGEQRALAQAGHVQVTLNTRTRARRQSDGGETLGLDLLAGEAAVDFQQSGRPFSITAGNGISTAESGRFEVRRMDDKVRVTCIEGTVRILHPSAQRQLQARQQAVYDTQAVSGVAAIDPAVVSAWRSGQLVFRQTRLAEALDEIGRYRPGRIVLMNDSVRDKAVTGHFAIASLDLALTQLQHVFGLTARTLPGGVLLLS